MFLRLYFELLAFTCELLWIPKMAENNTSTEYNLDENADCEGYKNEDIGDSESVVPDSDLDSSDSEVAPMGCSEVSSDHTDFGDDNGLITINDATVTANSNILNWTTNFSDKIIEPFTQDSGPSLHQNFNVFTVATAVDYFCSISCLIWW